MDVSIIIVNYNTKNILSDAIDSILNYTLNVTYEIIVVDNASSDGSVAYLVEKYPQIKIIGLDTNLGFGKANNLGLEAATGKYIFYLNSDTLFLNNAIFSFYSFMEKAEIKVGVCGSFLLGRDYKPVDSKGIFPTIKREWFNFISLLLQHFHLLSHSQSVEKKRCMADEYEIVEYVIGADMFMTRECALDFKFDERIFMYAEEAELQLRILKAGYKNILIEGPKIIHLEGGSSTTKEQEMLFKLKHMTQSLFYVIKKHHSYIYYSCFRLTYLLTHLILLISAKFSKEYKLNYLKILLSPSKLDVN